MAARDKDHSTYGSDRTVAVSELEMGLPMATAAGPSDVDFDEVTHGAARLSRSETRELSMPSDLPMGARDEPSLWSAEGSDGTMLSDVQPAMTRDNEEAEPEPPELAGWHAWVQPRLESLRDKTGDLIHDAGPRTLWLMAAGSILLVASLLWSGRQGGHHEASIASPAPSAAVADAQPPLAPHSHPMGHAAVHGRIKPSHHKHHHR